MEESLYAVWLTVKCRISRAKAFKLLEQFHTFAQIYALDGNRLAACKFLSDAEMLRLSQKELDDVERYCGLLEKHRVTLLPITSPRYPEILRTIDSPPVLLYCRGKFINLDEHLCIAMVGTRKASEYGLVTARRLAQNLASEGAIIVSGMAAGIDTASHEGALAAGKPTVAILGCGVNLVYPSTNARLMQRIMETGMVISEYPLNAEPEKWHFPERNRIISGLCSGLVVIEASIRSGSLITARLANEQGRDVYAVPGNINSVKSAGPNHLIKDGAGLVTCADDILDQYRTRFVSKLSEDGHPPVTQTEPEVHMEDVFEQHPADTASDAPTDQADKRILAALNDTPMHIDSIAEKTGLEMGQLNSRLLMLELAGSIVSFPGNRYTRTPH